MAEYGRLPAAFDSQAHDRFDATGTAAASSVVNGEIAAGGASTSAPPAFTATPAETETVTYGQAPISWDLGINNNVGRSADRNRLRDGQRAMDRRHSFRAMFGANFQNAAEYGYTGGPITNTVTGAGVTESLAQPTRPATTSSTKATPSNSLPWANSPSMRNIRS